MKKDSLLQRCLEPLRKLPNLKAVPVQPSLPVALEPTTVEAWLHLESPLDEVMYACTLTPRLSSATLGPIMAQLQGRRTTGVRPLLVVEYVPQPVSERLIAQGFEFIDTAGNMYLNSPAAYVLIQGQQPKREPKVAHTLTAATLKLVFVFLRDPEATGVAYRELAERAGTALGTVSHTIKQLHDLGYLHRSRQGGYQLLDYQKLLHRWELGYVETLRPKLLLGTFTPGTAPNVSERVEPLLQAAAQDGFLLGGELGAAQLTGHLRTQKVTLHVPADRYRPLLVRLRLKPDPQGDITLLQGFGTDNAWKQAEFLADPLLLRAELLIEPDERLRETAEQLLTKYILGSVNRAI